MSRLILLIKVQDCEMGVTRLVFELLAGHTVAKVTYCFMIGQFNYTMIKASTDKEWLLWLIKSLWKCWKLIYK